MPEQPEYERTPERPSDYVRALLDAAQIVADCATQGLGLAAAERAIRREACS